MLPDAAGVEDDYLRFFRVFRLPVSGLNEAAGQVCAVGLVHLTAEGPDIEFHLRVGQVSRLSFIVAKLV